VLFVAGGGLLIALLILAPCCQTAPENFIADGLQDQLNKPQRQNPVHIKG
jgi:hypothetical protein